MNINFKIIKALSILAAKKKIRADFAGVRVKCDADSTIYVSTNTHVAGVYREETQNTETSDIVIPTEILDAIKLTKFDVSASIKLIESNIYELSYYRTSVRFASLENGRYPRVEALLPTEFSNTETTYFDPASITMLEKAAKELEGGKVVICSNGQTKAAGVCFEKNPNFYGAIMPLMKPGNFEIPSWVKQ